MKQKFSNHFNRHVVPKAAPPARRRLSINSPQKLLEKHAQAHQLIASELARRGNYFEIVKSLENQVLLVEQINRIQQAYEATLNFEQAPFLFQEDSEKIWEALTVLELFDKNTFEKSLQDYLVAKEKIEFPVSAFDRQGIDLRKAIQSEGLTSFDQFYRACLLRELGKIEIPHFLIASQITNDEWAELLLDFDEKYAQTESARHLLKKMLSDHNLEITEEIKRHPQATYLQREQRKGLLLKFLVENEFPCAAYVPVAEAFDKKHAYLLGQNAFTAENLRELKKRGYDQNDSLEEIVKTYEKDSQTILANLNLQSEADLLADHPEWFA